LGIAIVNDFKSIEGDRAMGLQSLPVAFGIDTAKWICVGSIDVTQLSVAGECFTFLIKEVYTFPCIISDCQVLSLLCIALLTCRIILCR
jgi:4-hydroxybenzoate polyprenyltransferase